MIDFYDPNITDSTHTVRVTLMEWGYVGHVSYEIRGNCCGASILDIDSFECVDPDKFVENDCSFRYNEADDCFEYCLTEPATGAKCSTVDAEWEDVLSDVVAVEIVDRTPKKAV